MKLKATKTIKLTESGQQEFYRPNYYGAFGANVTEVWTFVRQHGLSFQIGNIIKYLVRAGKKENTTRLVDLKKAMTYLQQEIKWEEEEQRVHNDIVREETQS